MNKRRGCANWLLGIIIVPCILIALLMAYTFFFSSWSWHQKMTIVVNTPNGEVSAHSVQRVFWTDEVAVPGFPGGRATNSLKGEATVVELGNGKYLFALIKDAATLAQFVVLEPEILDGTMSERGAHLEQVGRKGIVPLNKYPMLVTFTDINNPASVKLVDPNDLNSTFDCSADGSSSSDNSTSSGNSSTPWLDAGLTWHAYQKQKAKQEIEQREDAFYKQRNALDKKISKLQKEFRVLSWKTIAPSGIIQGSEQAAFRKARDKLYVSSGYGEKLDPLRKQRVALKASFESKREALIAAPKKGRSTAKDCYSLKSITLEITDEPVSTGKVESVLGWLDEYYNQRLDGNRFRTVKAENQLANSLSSGAFDTEKN